MAKQVNTVAQALRRIKELKGRIALVSRRMAESVCWIEPGNKPPYAFSALDEERRALVEELVLLKGRLAKTNANTSIVADGRTMSIQTAVFYMAELKAERELLSTLNIVEGEFKDHTNTYDDKGRPIFEVKKRVAALSVIERDEAVAALEKRIAEVNEAIEDANHRTVLWE